MYNLINFFIYIFITAYTPGPNNIMSMSNAIRLGFKKSFPFNLGVLIGFAIVMPVCTIFSATLYQLIPKVKPFMLLIGAAYMLYLAWKTFKSAPPDEGEETKSASFLSGMLLQFINPKIYIYAIVSMSTYVFPFYHSNLVLLAFTLVLVLVGFSGTVLWALFGSAFCKVLSKHTKAVNITMALLLVYCAVSLFL